MVTYADSGEAPASSTRPHKLQAAASMIAIGFTILAVGHLGLYLFLTGDARAGISRLEAVYTVSDLEGAKRPDAAPLAGTPAYSPWLRSYERWHAGSEYTVHARHESLVRIGMILSFLVGLGLLGQGMLRTSHTPQRRSSDTRRRAPAPQHAPQRAPAHAPIRAPSPATAVRAPARRPVVARARPVKPVAVSARRLRKSA